MKIETYKCIALSTSHIKPSSFDWLTEQHINHDYAMCTFRDTGCFLKLHETLEDNIIDGIPCDLAIVIYTAWNHGARLIEFDNAAIEVDELPTFEWD